MKLRVVAMVVKAKAERAKIRHQISELSRQRETLAKSEFDYRAAEAKARLAKDYENKDQAIRLRSAYRALFKCVKVGAEKPNGQRDFEFVLNEDSSRSQGSTGGFGAGSGVPGNGEDTFCIRRELVASM